MHVIMLSGDQSVLERDSAFRRRAEEYAGLFESLSIIVPARTNVVDVVHDSRLRIIPISGAAKFYHEAAKLIRSLPKERVVVTAQEEIGGLCAALLSWRFGTRWQLQIHTDVFSPYFRRHSFKNRLRVYIIRFLLLRAHSIRVVSKRIMESIQKMRIQTAPIRVVPIYTDVTGLGAVAPKRSYENPEFDFVFLMVCRLASEKHIDMAMRSFVKVVHEAPKTLLRIVGDGPERQSLSDLVRSLGIGTRVQFEGWKEDVREYYVTDHALLSTSYYEGYGLAIVEAMASGMPVIATDTGIAGDLLRSDVTGIVTAVDSEDELTEAMLRVRKNYELRWRLGHAAAEAVSVLESKESYLKRFQESLELCLKKD